MQIFAGLSFVVFASIGVWNVAGALEEEEGYSSIYKPILENIHHKKAFHLLQTKLDNRKKEEENLRKRLTEQKQAPNKLKTAIFDWWDSEEEDDEPQEKASFSRAQSIRFFRNQIDPEIFEWINPDHVRAGYTTCGFLKPPLGVDDHEPFPTIRVKFCVRFADVQPASKGNLAVHCGGPSSLSGCDMGSLLGKDNLENYNIISLDQRGMGMSWPSFAHEECTYGVNVTNGTVALLGMDAFSIDATNETTILQFLQQQEDRVFSCWACDTCDFHLQATDGSGKTYHFLEYSGTRQVAQDLDTFRQAIGADKLSVFGISYGTQVMATYATMFPKQTDKFVIDANMPPQPDLYEFAAIIAENNHQRQSYLAYTCTLRNNIVPGSCDIDLNYCFQETFQYYEEIFHSIGVSQFQMAFLAQFSRSSILDTFKDACDAASTKDAKTFIMSLITLQTEPFPEPFSSCFTGIFEIAVDLLDTIGVPADAETPTMNDDNEVPLAAYYLTGLADFELCQTFVDYANDKEQQEELVYELWRQEFAANYTEDGYGNQHYLQDMIDESECSGPTYEDYSYPFLLIGCVNGSMVPADDTLHPYTTLMGQPSSIPQTMVLAQSMSGSSYDEQRVVQLVREMYDKYGGGFYGENSATNFFFWYTLGYYWPKAQPIAPAGDATVTGIVAGQLYDYVTAYEFTQDMKSAFPSTTLLTSQWTQHGLYAARATHNGGNDGGDEMFDDSCQIYINEYFETGIVDVVDGFTCGSILPDPFGDF